VFSLLVPTAQQLGVVKGAPNGACSRAFVEGGTHNLKADGVVFYNTGYAFSLGVECAHVAPCTLLLLTWAMLACAL
jgi:hypothetical protein